MKSFLKKKLPDPVITAVVYDPFGLNDEKITLNIFNLIYRNGTVASLPVSEESIDQFLIQANLYGATVFPNAPDAGCYAINGECMTTANEWPVSVIYCDGHPIYINV